MCAVMNKTPAFAVEQAYVIERLRAFPVNIYHFISVVNGVHQRIHSVLMKGQVQVMIPFSMLRED